MTTLSRFLPDAAATMAIGAEVGPKLQPGMVVFLCGDLGAGKTTLVRGLLRALGCSEKIKSPTYTLVELYTVSDIYFFHFDFYRFNDPQEWEEAGFREYFNADSVCLVEWPENAGELLPAPDLRIALKLEGEGRHASIQAETGKGAACLAALISPHWS